jgi:hypothetical protein
MRSTVIFAIGILTLLLISGFSLNVEAGVEPSPFKVEKVNAITNDLESINHRVQIVLNPESCNGNGAINGPVARLGAMSGQLEMLEERVHDIFDERLYSEDLTEEEADSVYQARVVVGLIKDNVNSYLFDPINREPIVSEELVPALVEVRTSAHELSLALQYYVIFPGDGGTGI